MSTPLATPREGGVIRVLISPAAFRDSFSALEVADAIELGVRQALPAADIVALPISDGGPELLGVLGRVLGGRTERLEVTGPVGAPVEARILWFDDATAVVASADACGLHLVPPGERNPCLTDSRGVGELVLHAAGAGAVSIIVGLGGSGTVDGGSGMARALGFSFLDAAGEVVAAGGCSLAGLARIVGPAETWLAPDIVALADVASPLLGPDGAARRFGPQKGATGEQVGLLEAGLERLAERMALDLGPHGADLADIPNLAGAGAAGGLGAGLAAFAGASLVPGARWVLDRIGFFSKVASADLVITGEGSWDEGSLLGKGPATVIAAATRAERPVWLVAGRVKGEVPRGVRVIGGHGARVSLADISLLAAQALLDR
ncbi:MAG: glycerate kinase [Gemmatimonadota bacterium]